MANTTQNTTAAYDSSLNPGGLSAEVAVYYERRFLERARAMLVHQEGAQLRALEGNAGKQVIFNRFSPLSLATTALILMLLLHFRNTVTQFKLLDSWVL